MKAFALAAALVLAAPAAHAFTFSFTWDGLKLCTSGSPNRVGNPVFKVKNVPAGTTAIRFKLKDLDVPSYNHGGGWTTYSCGKIVAAGQFKYKSPCPPNGKHDYEWTATAYTNKNGKKLGVAKAARPYP